MFLILRQLFIKMKEGEILKVQNKIHYKFVFGKVNKGTPESENCRLLV